MYEKLLRQTTEKRREMLLETSLLFYSISEQLLGPTGSLRQLDMAITAASMDASSPCFSRDRFSRLHVS